MVQYSSNQTLPYMGVTKKKLSSFCLQWTTCIMQENEARNCTTSIRSQMILEFWNIRSLNLSFLWATDPNFLLFGRFGHPYRQAGDWLSIWETPGYSWRVSIYAIGQNLKEQITHMKEPCENIGIEITRSDLTEKKLFSYTDSAAVEA